ncbi:MAG: 50S ribosomal protein L15 [Candidatus Moranbacteria bacterium]|nr:50S ribosomal protein L15 [Candidatus Moranbacteria bacterium]
MQIHELKVNKRKSKKRVGRGGKRGTYSGRGMNGQKSRSGGNVDPLFEGGRSSLIQRMKKLRGFKAINAKKNNVNLDQIEQNFSDGDVINEESLLSAKLIKKSKDGNGVKILGDGKITKKIVVGKDVLVSESAKVAIEKAGGKFESEKKSKEEK